MATRAATPTDSQREWNELIVALRAELPAAVEETIEMMQGLSYRVMDDLTLRNTGRQSLRVRARLRGRPKATRACRGRSLISRVWRAARAAGRNLLRPAHRLAGMAETHSIGSPAGSRPMSPGATRCCWSSSNSPCSGSTMRVFRWPSGIAAASCSAPAERLEQALANLAAAGQATRQRTLTAGRPAELWTATRPDA